MSQVAEDTRASEASRPAEVLQSAHESSFNSELESNPSNVSSDYDSETSQSHESQSTSSHPHNKRQRKHRHGKANDHSNELVHQPQQYSHEELIGREPTGQQVANNSEEKSSAPKLRLDMDLEAELDLKVKVKGDVTLSILEG